jgi:hypothetical protein
MKWRMLYSNNTSSRSPIPKIEYDDNEPVGDYEWLQLVDEYIDNCKTQIVNIQFNSKINPTEKRILSIIKSLRDNPDIVLKPADKNLGTVVLSTTDYNNMCYNLLGDHNSYQCIINKTENDIHNCI